MSCYVGLAYSSDLFEKSVMEVYVHKHRLESNFSIC